MCRRLAPKAKISEVKGVDVGGMNMMIQYKPRGIQKEPFNGYLIKKAKEKLGPSCIVRLQGLKIQQKHGI